MCSTDFRGEGKKRKEEEEERGRRGERNDFFICRRQCHILFISESNDPYFVVIATLIQCLIVGQTCGMYCCWKQKLHWSVVVSVQPLGSYYT